MVAPSRKGAILRRSTIASSRDCLRVRGKVSLPEGSSDQLGRPASDGINQEESLENDGYDTH